MKPRRRRYPKGISVSAIKSTSANDLLCLWSMVTSELLDVPPRGLIDSKGVFPTRDECAAGLARMLEALRRKVYAS